MKIQIFGSSSAGNCIRVYNDEFPGVYLDAGVNPSILMAAGAPLANMPFFITHEHGDHAKYIRDLCSKYGAYVFTKPRLIPVIPYLQSLDNQKHWGRLQFGEEVAIAAGESFSAHTDMYVTPFSIIHYPAEDPVCFMVELNSERLLYLVDCGQLPDQDSIPPCDIYFIEANYTPEALAKNDNQWIGVKARVQSGFGHLSVLDAYEFLKPRMNHTRKIIFGHMSRNNFDLHEYERIIPADFRERVTLASAGLMIDTDPF